MFKLFYVCIWFYFSPFSCLFLSYQLPFMMSEVQVRDRFTVQETVLNESMID